MVDAGLNATLLLDLETLQVEYANITACELVGRERSGLLGHPRGTCTSAGTSARCAVSSRRYRVRTLAR